MRTPKIIIDNEEAKVQTSRPRIEITEDEISVFALYKDHVIEGQRTGHPQTQNLLIDGKPQGYVVFPTPVIAIGRSIVDARIELGL